MTKVQRSTLALLVSLLPLPSGACVGPAAPEGDSANASFGGAAAKADGFYTECELREVLQVVNRSTTTFDSLDRLFHPIATHETAAANIIAHRNGPDGALGTGDDDLFDDLGELDAVEFVGPVALERMIVSVADACDLPVLADRPFIDDDTFAGTSGGGWGRDNVELEATYTATGVTGALLREILVATDDRGRTTFSRIRKNSDLEAFTYGYGVDEMPWDRDSHSTREDMPYVMLSIEPGRFDPDEATGIRELSLGTDIMDDTYFDTQGFDLLHRQLSLRGRARWDDATTIRRLLIASKSGSTVNEEGIKSAAKIDVRIGYPSAQQIASLNFDVMRGTVDWGGSDTPVEAIRSIYERLSGDGVLLDMQGHQGVLLLEPMAHLRSTRSRLHFNEASLYDIQRLHTAGTERIASAVATAEEMLAADTVTGADVDVLTNLVAFGKGIIDRSLVAERANQDLVAAGLPGTYDASTVPMPASFGRVTGAEQVEEHRIVAEAISDLYHEFADVIDDADRIFADSRDRAWDDHGDYYVAWVQSQDHALARKTVIEPYLTRYESMTAETHMAAFNTWGAAQRADGNEDFEEFDEIDAAGWDAMGNSLRLEMYKVHKRIVEASGTMARALWFDEAREYYVPGSSRNPGNFFIDTTDMTDMVSHQEWLTLTRDAATDAGSDGGTPTDSGMTTDGGTPTDSGTPSDGGTDSGATSDGGTPTDSGMTSDGDQFPIDRDLPAEVVFHTTLVNEVQIELGSEVAYLARINALRELVDAGTATADDEASIEGARFIFNQYQGALAQIAELKRSRVRRYLRRVGRLLGRDAAQDVEWDPATHSKGHTALRFLADVQ
ncbi:MAG: hypothetical protein JRH11_02535 [Deltaproteobacteria bacterium]|nr:hypothetical protein [Deltaproteobacteria bacterium]